MFLVASTLYWIKQVDFEILPFSSRQQLFRSACARQSRKDGRRVGSTKAELVFLQSDGTQGKSTWKHHRLVDIESFERMCNVKSICLFHASFKY